jgi:hypothetical protein
MIRWPKPIRAIRWRIYFWCQRRPLYRHMIARCRRYAWWLWLHSHRRVTLAVFCRRLTRDRESWAEIVRRDPCSYCGSTAEPTVEHIRPGRTKRHTGWENEVCACRACNNKRGNIPLLEFLWMRHTGQHPTLRSIQHARLMKQRNKAYSRAPRRERVARPLMTPLGALARWTVDR